MEAPVYFERVSLCNVLLFIKYEIFSVLTRDHLLFIIVYYCRNQILPTQFQSLFNLSKMYNGNKIVSIISLLIVYHVSKIHHFPLLVYFFFILRSCHFPLRILNLPYLPS